MLGRVLLSRARLAIVCAAGVTALWAVVAATPRDAGPGGVRPGAVRTVGEVRALWVTRTTLASPDAITAMVRSAAAAGFNTLLVQVRGRGDAYFAGGPEPRGQWPGQPEAWDPLQFVLRQAHQAGLRVHAWINANLVANAVDLPQARSHLVYRHPEWLMVPRALAAEMQVLSPGTTLYREKLSRWVRAQAAGIEGLYLSPIPRDAARYTVDVISDVAARYPVDGVHLDYVRYPSADFDYSRAALSEFDAHLREGRTEAERREIERRTGGDLLAAAAAYPAEWRAFRRDRLTELVAGLRAEIRRRRPGVLLTAAVVPDAAEAVSQRLQDWPAWLERGLLDAACPMAYAADAAGFASQIAAARNGAGGRPIWAGIGAYRLSSAQAIENIQTARRYGVAGVVLFSYDSLASPPQRAGEYLSLLGRAVFQ
jgi:uncharacterized lipoprotein YddW (UPF0748 family)